MLQKIQNVLKIRMRKIKSKTYRSKKTLGFKSHFCYLLAIQSENSHSFTGCQFPFVKFYRVPTSEVSCEDKIINRKSLLQHLAHSEALNVNLIITVLPTDEEEESGEMATYSLFSILASFPEGCVNQHLGN